MTNLAQPLHQLLENQFILTTDSNGSLLTSIEKLTELCQFLRDDDRFFFDYLACITAIDNGATANTMEVIYTLTSIPYNHNLNLRVVLPRNAPNEPLPQVPTVSHIWRTADWHEREAFDLLGITFNNHPDMRRILLPEDWPGHPLRRDYQEPERYHGIVNK
jgi:NADH-quinone oxidoreductase subunit C